MALLSVIRRGHYREEMPIQEIERRTGLSRNTIRKYLRAGTVEAKFKVPERLSKLDPFAEQLSAWLRIEASRSRKQRRTARQMHADLVVLGYDGSYNRVAAFVRDWKTERQRYAHTSGRGTFVLLAFMPGEAFQSPCIRARLASASPRPVALCSARCRGRQHATWRLGRPARTDHLDAWRCQPCCADDGCNQHAQRFDRTGSPWLPGECQQGHPSLSTPPQPVGSGMRETS